MRQLPKSVTMSEFTFLDVFVALAAAILVAGIVVLLAFKGHGKAAKYKSAVSVASSEFRISDGKLIDNRHWMQPFPFGPSKPIENWKGLRQWLEPRFGDLPEKIDQLSKNNLLKIPAKSEADPAILTLKSFRRGQSITLIDRPRNEAIELHRARMQEHQLASSLAVMAHAPYAMRCEDVVTGEVWQNEAFCTFSDREVDLFLAAAKASTADRVRIEDPLTGEKSFFRVDTFKNEAVSVIYLMDVTEVARAEKVRREFIQTLTKTFANLTTGLAVFDRHKHLALFNPALMDLTNLPAVFLSSKPTMPQFFDRLRDNKVLPEPKNYGNWRQQIDDMIQSASDGLYFEDWSLANGETYRVAGRPHPDGAIAFLFEDISDEIALTRRFRSQIDIRQAALDTCEQAITIIGPSNVVLLCNRPASVMLGIDPDSSFAEMSITDFLQACSERLPHDRFWTLAETKVMDRNHYESVIPDISGQPHRCTIRPIRGNSVLVSITEEAREETLPTTERVLSV